MKATTYLYDSEGRDNLAATLKHVAKAANTFDVGAVVVFARSVESALTLRDQVDDSREVVAITFPAGYVVTIGDTATYVGIRSNEDRQRLAEARVTIVQSVMPFSALGGADMEGLRTLKRALGLFGGGMQLCVQAVLMGCDAGAIQPAQRCIAMSADTAIVAHAENAFNFLSDQSRFSVEHIICKPVAYSITRPSVTALQGSHASAIAPATEQPLGALPTGAKD